MTLRCDETRANLSAHLDDALESETAARLGDHLRTCEGCRRELEALRRMKEILSVAGRIRAPEPWVRAAIREAAKESATEIETPRARVLARPWALSSLAAAAALAVIFLSIRTFGPGVEMAPLPPGSQVAPLRAPAPSPLLGKKSAEKDLAREKGPARDKMMDRDRTVAAAPAAPAEAEAGLDESALPVYRVRFSSASSAELRTLSAGAPAAQVHEGAAAPAPAATKMRSTAPEWTPPTLRVVAAIDAAGRVVSARPLHPSLSPAEARAIERLRGATIDLEKGLVKQSAKGEKPVAAPSGAVAREAGARHVILEVALDEPESP